ncbi:MAG: VOC family protein [Ignavibacteriae bacterium]|nr:MAG: VOC family protein [Ignavibacteriota bacterium]
MLANSTLSTVLPVVDLNRARIFYEEILGLKPVSKVNNGQIKYECGNGSSLYIYHQDESTKAGHTAAAFEVKNIELELEELESKGVTFEDYDAPGLKTINHIIESENEKAAWFKDADGNILCLHESL